MNSKVIRHRPLLRLLVFALTGFVLGAVSGLRGQPNVEPRAAPVAGTAIAPEGEASKMTVSSAGPTQVVQSRDPVDIAIDVVSIDPARSIAIVNTLPAERRVMALGTVCAAWAQRNLPSMLRWLDAMPPGIQKTVLLTRLAKSLSRGVDASIYAAVVMRLPPDEGAQYKSDAALSLAQRDLNEALDWIAHLSTDRDRLQAVSGLTDRWIGSDPDVAIAYGMSLTNAPGCDRLLAEMGDKWLDQDPERARDWIQRLPESPLRADLIGPLYAAWSRYDLAGAVAAIETIESSSERDRALAAVMKEWAAEDPEQAVSWVAAHVAVEAAEPLLEILAEGWFHLDRAGAKNWIETLPEGSVRDRCLEMVRTYASRTWW